MGAIAVHHTATSEATWDGPANKTRLKNTRAALRGANAWVDPEGDPLTKEAYRFIHHFVSADGDPGDASTVACSTGVGVLNGARGGTTIPDADRSGVWRHLAAHIKDAGGEPPELKRLEDGGREIKHIDIEVKTAGDEGTFEGLAAVYGVTDLGGDIIEPGAFTKTIEENPLVPVLWQHDAHEVIGQAKMTDSRLGPKVAGQLDMQDPLAVKALRKLKNGLVRGLSIGFQALKWDFQEPEGGGYPTRVIKELKLWEISIVTFPMLPEAQVTSAKSLEGEARNLAEAIYEAKAGRVLSKTSAAKIRAAIEELTALLEEAGAEDATTSAAAAGKSIEPEEIHSLLTQIKIETEKPKLWS